MTVDIIGPSRKKREDFPSVDNSKFEGLSEYITIAQKVISYFCPRMRKGLSGEMLSSEDAVSHVAEAVMMADWLWDENYIGKNGLKCSKRSYRNLRGLWAIKSYLTRRTRNKNKKMASLNYQPNGDSDLYSYIEDEKIKDPLENLIDSEKKEAIEKILSSGAASEKQKLYLRMHYLKSMSVAEISEEIGVSRQAIHESIRRALIKMRGRFSRNGNQ